MLENDLLDYILELMDAQDKKESELAVFLGVHQSQISRMFKPRRDGVEPKGKKPRELKVKELEKIFQWLGVPLSKDIMVAKRKHYVNLAPLRGTLAHGVWRQKEMLPKTGLREIPFLPVGEWAHLEQYAYEISDTHAEHFSGAQSFVLCVSYAQARGHPTNNDIVVIERQNVFPGGKGNVVAIERAVRKMVEDHGHFILKSLSSDPEVDDIAYDPSDTSIRITDLVIGTVKFADYVSI